MCSCGIEPENHFRLESLAGCHDANSQLVMYFMVNTAFVNYLDQFPNLTESLEFPIIKKQTTFEQTLPLYLNVSKFDSDLLMEPRNLKDFIHQYNHKKEIFSLNKNHDSTDLITNKNFFSNNYIVDIFLLITAVISLLVTTLAIYLLCKHKKLRTLVDSLALEQVQEVGTVTQKEINTECKISDLHKFCINNFWSSDGCNYTLQKIKTVQRIHVLLCSENHDFPFGCIILCTYKIM